jgi:hypothetical protein
MLRAVHHRSTDRDLVHITAAGRTNHITVRHFYRRGATVEVVLYGDTVIATFGAPYDQTGQSSAVVWYRSATGTWEGHATKIAALRTLATRHLPPREATAA